MNSNCSEINSTIQALGLLAPNDENWKERTPGWYATFNAMVVMIGLFYVGIATYALVSLCKRRSAARFKKVRTFIAIDIALLLLGVSRVAFLSLDPWGQNEYFTCRGCVIVSRLLSTIAFPSLTASYTLLFITLWISARIRLGTFMIQKLKVILPLCFLHYVIAFLVEVIASVPLSPFAALILVVVCEAIFSLWGILLCIAFMIAGVRLLHTIKMSARSSSVVCRDTPQLSRHDLIMSNKEQKPESPSMLYRQRTKSKIKTEAQAKHHRAVRKITHITYFTASLAILYSSLVMINLIFICLTLFDGCAGTIGGKKLSPDIWLLLRWLQFATELLLAVVLLYSNTDCRPFLHFIKQTFYCTTKTEASDKKELPTIQRAEKDNAAIVEDYPYSTSTAPSPQSPIY